MNVKEAIGAAKAYADEVFTGEKVSNIGVEEVEKDGGVWRITLGLSRPWENSALSVIGFDARASHRTYHVFSVSDETGEVSGFTLRERA